MMPEPADGERGPSHEVGCLGLADPGGDCGALVAGDVEGVTLRNERLLVLT
jgi:hypothetical protein